MIVSQGHEKFSASGVGLMGPRQTLFLKANSESWSDQFGEDGKRELRYFEG